MALFIHTKIGDEKNSHYHFQKRDQKLFQTIDYKNNLTSSHNSRIIIKGFVYKCLRKGKVKNSNS